MYVFEFTDDEIKIYNKKKKILIVEKIPEHIILNNKIYDYLKLKNILNDIVNNHRIINNLFQINIKILIFDNLTPSEEYLFANIFNNISNIKVELVNVKDLFNNNYLFISGNIIYFESKPISVISKGEYILVGNSSNYSSIKKKLEKKYKINILEYENSNTIIYEKI